MKKVQDELQTIEENSDAIVKERIPNAASARSMFEKTLENYKPEAQVRSKIQGLIDGNPPYRQSDLKRLGQGWRANVNFREAEAIVESNASAYWELIMEVPTFINVEIDDEDDLMQPSEDWGAVIAEEYTRTLKRWHGYFHHMMLTAYEFLKYGVSSVFWPDENDWKFEAIKTASMLVPANTKCNVDDYSIVYIRGEMKLDKVYSLIEETPEQAKAQGWDLNALKMALVLVFKKGQHIGTDEKYQLSDYEDVQQRIKNNDYATDEMDTEELHVVHILTKEPNGSISHKMILEDTNLVWEGVEEEQYIFNGEHKYNEFHKIMCSFFYSVGDGYYKSVKGLGHRIFPHVSFSDRFINNTLDGAAIASSLILHRNLAPGAEDADGRLLKIGPVTIIPSGYDPVQQSFTPPIQHMIGVRTMLQGVLNNNTGVLRPRQEDPNQVEKTARQSIIEEQKEARFEKNKITLFYQQWDRLHQVVFERLLNKDYPTDSDGYKEAKRFKDRCLARGVPEDILNGDKMYVTASRGIGLGSPALKSMVTTEVLQIASMLDERGKQNAIRDWLASRVGYTNVNRYAPIQNRDLIPTSEHSLATLEHNDLVEGKPVPVGVDQPHVTHLNIHMPKLIEIVEIFRTQPQQINYDMVVPYLSVAIPHAGEHINYMKQDPNREAIAGQYEEALKEVIKVFQQMQQQAAQITQARQAQAEQQAQALAQQPTKEQMDMQLKAQQQQFDQQLDAQKQENLMRVRELKAQHSIELKRTVAEAELDIKRRMAQAEGVEA